jgi:hypothetical protein
MIDHSDRDWSPVNEALSGPQPQLNVNPRMRGMHEGMDEIIDPDTPAMVPDNPSYTFHRERIKKYANNFEVALVETPTSYPFNFEDKSFPFYFAVDQFKGGEDVNRVEVNIEFPADLSPGDEALTKKTYNAAAVFFDANYEEISRQESELVLPTTLDTTISEDDEESKSVRLIPAQLLFTLPEDYYRLAITVEEMETENASSYKTTMAFNNYRMDLAISDIVFASKIAPAERQSPFNRGALEVVPHPLRRYRKSEVMPVYFEVYNLELNDDGTSEYTVEYQIVPNSPKKDSFWNIYDSGSALIASRFEASSYGSTDAVHISLRTDNLRAGIFDLMVTVKDEITQAVVFRRATFNIVD